MGETIRLEEFTGTIQNKLVAVWHTTETPWLPTEFMLSQYITRILVVGRTSPMSMSLAADPSWTQVWRSPGGIEWSCLAGILPHMPGPILIVIGPDIVLTPKLLSAIRGVMTIVMRSPSASGWPAAGPAPDHVFFPVVPPMGALQEWQSKATPRGLDFKTLLPQLTAQQYGLTVADGAWHWYKPADSPPLATLTVLQIARQIHIMGSLLESL